MRTWNGRSGSPSGSTVEAGSVPMAKSATTASARPTAALAGNSMWLMNGRLRGRTSPTAPIAIQAAIPARTRSSACKSTGARSGQHPRRMLPAELQRII